MAEGGEPRLKVALGHPGLREDHPRGIEGPRKLKLIRKLGEKVRGESKEGSGNISEG